MWKRDTLLLVLVLLKTQVQWLEVFLPLAQLSKEAALEEINMLDTDKKLDFTQMSIFIESSWPFLVNLIRL